jgi:hypothetical protein
MLTTMYLMKFRLGICTATARKSIRKPFHTFPLSVWQAVHEKLTNSDIDCATLKAIACLSRNMEVSDNDHGGGSDDDESVERLQSFNIALPSHKSLAPENDAMDTTAATTATTTEASHLQQHKNGAILSCSAYNVSSHCLNAVL